MEKTTEMSAAKMHQMEQKQAKEQLQQQEAEFKKVTAKTKTKEVITTINVLGSLLSLRQGRRNGKPATKWAVCYGRYGVCTKGYRWLVLAYARALFPTTRMVLAMSVIIKQKSK